MPCLGPLRIRKSTPPVTAAAPGFIQVPCPAGQSSALPPALSWLPMLLAQSHEHLPCTPILTTHTGAPHEPWGCNTFCAENVSAPQSPVLGGSPCAGTQRGAGGTGTLGKPPAAAATCVALPVPPALRRAQPQAGGMGGRGAAPCTSTACLACSYLSGLSECVSMWVSSPYLHTNSLKQSGQ